MSPVKRAIPIKKIHTKGEILDVKLTSQLKTKGQIHIYLLSSGTVDIKMNLFQSAHLKQQGTDHCSGSKCGMFFSVQESHLTVTPLTAYFTYWKETLTACCTTHFHSFQVIKLHSGQKLCVLCIKMMYKPKCSLSTMYNSLCDFSPLYICI